MFMRGRRWRYISFLLSFAMILEAAGPLGAVSAMAAQTDTVQETVPENEQTSSFENEGADEWLDSYGNVKVEEELSEDEYDDRGPLSAFTSEDNEKAQEAAPLEDAVSDEAMADNQGRALILLPNGERAKVSDYGDLNYYLLNLQMYPKATLSILSNFTLSREAYIPEGRDYTIWLNGYTVTGSGCRFMNIASNSTVTIDGANPDPNGKKGRLQNFTSGKTDGGAFFVEARSRVVMKNLDVINCSAGNGGVINLKKQSDLRLYNTTFDGNKAANRGGAIYVNGTKANISMDSESKLRWNSAGTHGGAIYLNDSRAGIYGGARGTLIEHNSCGKNGGGIYVDGSNAARNAGNAVIRNLRFEYNSASGGSGGAMYINCGGCTFAAIKASGNSAKDLGGAVCVIGSSKPKDRNTGFSDLELTGNRLTAKKSYGGGLYAASTQNVSLSGLVKVQDNTANGKTDNIYLWDAKEHAYLVLDSLAPKSMIGILRKKTSFGKVTKNPTFVDLRCLKYDNPAYHLELSQKTGKEYLLIKSGSPAAAPRPSVTKLDLSEKTKGTVDGTYTTADGTSYDRIAGYASSPSHTNEKTDIVNKYFFSDGYFMDDPDKYNIHLATMGMNVAMASADSNIKGHNDYRYKFDNIKSLLLGIGCREEDIYINDWYIEKPTDDSIGVAIAKKKIHDKKNNKDYYLVPIAIRSYGYEKEWASNMTLNGKNTEGQTNPESSGFRSARSHVVDSLEYFIDHYGLRSEIEQGNVKFWLNGFSRGSATANLTGKYLVDTYGKYSKNNKDKPNQVFAYCYAVPAGGTDTSEAPEAAGDDRKGYYCIHNIINKVDLTPMVAPELMGFKRYGVDHFVPGTKDAGDVKKEKKFASVDNGSYPITLMYDNEAYMTGSGTYNADRQRMLDQLLGVNQEVNFTDYFKVHGINSLGNGLRLEGSKYQRTIESWLPDMYSKLQGWDSIGDGKNLSRSNYSNYLMKEGKDGGRWSKGISPQDAFRGLVMLMLSKTPSEKDALSTAIGSMKNKLAAPASTEKGPSVLTIYKKLICKEGWKKKDEQQKWLDFFWGKLTDDSYGQPSIKDRSVMSDAELKAFESYFPALMGIAFRLAPRDKKENNLRLIATFVKNTETILQGHVPEIYLAWLRQYDSYYDKEAKKAYEFASGGSEPAVPQISLAPGKYPTNQKLELKADGCAIYYSIRKGYETSAPLKLYRSGEGISLTGNRSSDVEYAVEYYAIRDRIENGVRTWSESEHKTEGYTLEAKRLLKFKTRPDQTEYQTAYYAPGESVTINSGLTVKDKSSIDYWSISGDPIKYSGDTLCFVMPDRDVTVEPHFSPLITRVSKIQVAEEPKLNQPGSAMAAVTTIELEASDGSKVYYPVTDPGLHPKWVKPTRVPKSGEFTWDSVKKVEKLNGEEWLLMSLNHSFKAQDGKNYRFSKEINDYHDADASICADYFTIGDGMIKVLYRPSAFGKYVVRSIEAPKGSIYPYCATADEIGRYLEDEEVTLHLENNEMKFREEVEWNTSAYIPDDAGGSYSFTGTLKNAVSYDLTKVSAPVITVKVNAKTLSPVPTADLTSGEYVKEAGRDEEKFENNNLKVTARVKDYEGNPGTIYYKAVEYTTGEEPAAVPDLSEMTEAGSDGKITLEGTEGTTRKYKLWLRGENDAPYETVSEAVSYTYEVTVPKYRNVSIEIWDVNTSKALYKAEPEPALVGDPVYYCADEVLEAVGDEKLSEAYDGAYWTSSVSSDKVTDPDFYLEKMPDEDLTLKLYAAQRIDYVVIYTDEDVTPRKGGKLNAQADEIRIMLGGKEYTISGNRAHLAFSPDDRTALGNTVYTISGNLSFKDMKGQEDEDEPVIDLGGKYSLSGDMVVELVSPGESGKIQIVPDADEDEDGLYEKLGFSHTFAMTEKPEITDVYEPEDVVIPWTAGADRSYEKLVEPKLPGQVHVITDDGSLSSLPVEWGLPHEPEEGYDESSVRPQDLLITGYVTVPEEYKAYDLDDESVEVDRYEVEVSVALEGAPLVKMPKPDPDGAVTECMVVSGNAAGSIDVAMSCETEGADIYYTLDGTDPLDSKGNTIPQAVKYVSGNLVTITGKPDDEVTLKLAATKSGMQPSEIYTNFYEFVRPEAEIPEYDLEDILELALMPGQKLGDLKLPEGWYWDTEAMDDPAAIPEDDEYEPGDIVDAAVYYNPDPANYEDVSFDIEIPIIEKEYGIAVEAGSCMAYTMVSASEIPEGDEGDYTPYEGGSYLNRVYTAPQGETVVIIFNKKIDDKDYTGLIKKTASGRDISLTKEPKEYGPETYCAEFIMPEEDVIISPVYEKKGAYKVESLTVDKQSVSMNVFDKTELNVTVTCSSTGKGDRPKPELVELSNLVEQVGEAVEDGGKYKYTLKAVAPGKGTLWVCCGDRSQPVAVDINEDRQRLVNVTKGRVTKVDGKAVEGSPASCYVKAGSSVTLEADPPSSLYVFDRWILKGADVSDSSLSLNEITFTVNGSVEAEATYTEDPEYKKNDEKKDTDKKVKSLKLAAADGSTGMVFDLNGKGADLEKTVIATAVYYDGTQPEITFESSNTGVAGVKRIGTGRTGTVSANIVAIGPGEAVITAYCGDKSAGIRVSVAEKSEGARILMDGEPTESFGMNVGEQTALTAAVYPLSSTDQVTGVTWKVVKDKNNKNVISVKKGLVTAKKAGTARLQAVIKVKPAGAKKAITLPAAQCTITVKAGENDKPRSRQNDKSYKLSLSKSSIKIDGTASPMKELTISLASLKKPLTVEQLISGNEITAESTNLNVVEVEELGELAKDSKGKTARADLKIMAIGPGTAYIIVKSKQDEKQENIRVCRITVTTPVKEIKLTGDSAELFPGEPAFPGVSGSGTDAVTITMKQGSYDRLYYDIDPSNTTDIGKISWSAKGGVTVKNGVIYAKSISKTDKKTGSIKPAEVTLKCGKIKHTIKVIVQ